MSEFATTTRPARVQAILERSARSQERRREAQRAGERFSGRRALRRAGGTVDTGAGHAAGGGQRLARRLTAPSETAVMSAGELAIWGLGTLIGLALLDTALRGRGPAGVDRLLELAGGAFQRLFDPHDPLFARGTPAGPAVSPSPPAGPAGPTGTRSRAPAKGFGAIIGRPHQGTHNLGDWQSDNAVDISLPNNTPLYAPVSGVISKVKAGDASGRFQGVQVTIAGPDGGIFMTHLARANVRAGTVVRAGQLIGTSGSANGVPHLHLGVERGDPARYARLTYSPVRSPAARARAG